MLLNTAYSCALHAHCLVNCTQLLHKVPKRKTAGRCLCFEVMGNWWWSFNWCCLILGATLRWLGERFTSTDEEEICVPMSVYVRDKKASSCLHHILLTGSMLKIHGSLSCSVMICVIRNSFPEDDVCTDNGLLFGICCLHVVSENNLKANIYVSMNDDDNILMFWVSVCLLWVVLQVSVC